jgi:hypothetical protein
MGKNHQFVIPDTGALRLIQPMDPNTTQCQLSCNWRLVSGAMLLFVAMAGCRVFGNRDPFTASEPLALSSQLVPSNHRDWSPDLAVLSHAEFDGNEVKVHNIRNCTYRADDEYVVRHYDKTFDLDKIIEVDFVVVPFRETPSLAHTLLSFGFDGEDYVSVSVEARLEKSERYSPVLGAMRQFELMYVIADERDVLLRRTKFRGVDVYLYRTRATPKQARELFVDVMSRVNKLYREPEFYDTVTNNCTSNIVQHINRLQPNRLSLYDPRVLLPGYADHLAYDLGLLDTSKSFAQLREEARINARANRYADRKDFSELIRR